MAVARPNGADHALLYVPGRSLMHRLNPLTKLTCVLWVAVAAFALPPQGTIPLRWPRSRPASSRGRVGSSRDG